MADKVTKLALASRLILLIVQLLANLVCPDHNPDVFRAPIALQKLNASNTTAPTPWLENAIVFSFGGLRNWDGEYFLHIAEYGYSYENTLAFYPLFPLVVKTGAYILNSSVGLGLSLRSWCLVIATFFNVACFCKAANVLYDLTQRIFNDFNKSWNATLLFCFNPASVFFTAAYSETLFSFLTFTLMLECVCDLNLIRVTISLAANMLCRSNGLTNIGFPIYFLLRQGILKNECLKGVIRLLSCILFSLWPLIVFYTHAYYRFCNTEIHSIDHSDAVVNYAYEKGYLLAGPRQQNQSPWCDKFILIRNPYSYVQSHYWNVGFLRYYVFKQWPNFVLALPIISFLGYHCCKYLSHFSTNLLRKYPLKQLLREYKSLPFVLHATFLTTFCILFTHVQISTRLLGSATPCLYWFAADHFPNHFGQVKMRSKAGCILIWFSCYYLIGTTLFSNNFPWT